jgi:hypothetical protein
MYASFRFIQATRHVRSLSTAAVSAPGRMERLQAFSSKNKDTATILGAMAGGAAAIVYAANYTMGWQPKITALEEKVAGLVKKEDFAKVETEVKNLGANLATKEAVGKVETEVKNVLQSARLEGENAALRAWKEKEASVAGGRRAGSR